MSLGVTSLGRILSHSTLISGYFASKIGTHALHWRLGCGMMLNVPSARPAASAFSHSAADPLMSVSFAGLLLGGPAWGCFAVLPACPRAERPPVGAAQAAVSSAAAK